MKRVKGYQTLVYGIILLVPLFFTEKIWADTANSRLYKISVLIFKHSPAGKDTSPRLTDRWTENFFLETTDVASLPPISSSLLGSNDRLLHDKNYTLLYSSAWIASLENDTPTTFHFHKNSLDGLITVTLKYNLDVHFQTQLLDENKIIGLDEIYQTQNNQLQYIDGPIYGALVLMTRYGEN